MSEPTLLARSHPTVRRLRALRSDRALRDEQRVFVAEGPRLALEAIGSRASIEVALCTQGLDRELEERLRNAGVPLRYTAPGVHRMLQDARSPQPVLLVVRRAEVGVDDVVRAGETAPLVVIAHGIQDPGNLGSILRTAEASGASGMLVCGDSADLYHPRTVRATAGSIFRLPALRCELDTVTSALEAARLHRVAATPGAGRDYRDLDLRGPTAILLGGEGAGLPAELAASADSRARIPMAEGVESLSVAAAAAVLLFEAARQRRSFSRDG